jgi:hypothetical protein
MAANPASRNPPSDVTDWSLVRTHRFPGLRALAWDGNVLYASRGYQLLRAEITMQPATTAEASRIEWQPVARYRPGMARHLSSSLGLAARLFRDGFHALAVLPSGHIIGAVPGAMITLSPGEAEFRISHRLLRGTRPLHITVTPEGRVFWGEYFDNPHRDEVHIYGSADRGTTWSIAHTFPKGAIRHVHNIVHDPWGNCLWILTGDDAAECRILRSSCDLQEVDVILSGSQQTRAVALVPAEQGLYFSSDTPLERNRVYGLDRRGNVSALAELSSSSIYGCRVGNAIFFSTMIEPSEVNLARTVHLYATLDGKHWQKQLRWAKDPWPMGLFQYGNAVLPDGNNASGLLGLTTVAVRPGDLETSLWRILNQ